MITDALVVASPGAPFKFQKVELDDTLRPTECLIRIKATGVSPYQLSFATHTQHCSDIISVMKRQIQYYQNPTGAKSLRALDIKGCNLSRRALWLLS